MKYNNQLVWFISYRKKLFVTLKSLAIHYIKMCNFTSPSNLPLQALVSSSIKYENTELSEN